MRRFTDNIDQQCAVMLISSDVNLSLDLSDFKNRKKIHVILLHNVLVSETLLLCSNEHFVFDDLFDEVACSSQLPKVKGTKYSCIHNVLNSFILLRFAIFFSLTFLIYHCSCPVFWSVNESSR